MQIKVDLTEASQLGFHFKFGKSVMLQFLDEAVEGPINKMIELEKKEISRLDLNYNLWISRQGLNCCATTAVQENKPNLQVLQKYCQWKVRNQKSFLSYCTKIPFVRFKQPEASCFGRAVLDTHIFEFE